MANIEDTAVPCPYARLIVGTRHCRVLISGNINFDTNGIDITATRETFGIILQQPDLILLKTESPHLHLPQS